MPKIASVQLILDPLTSIKNVSSDVEDIVKGNLDNLKKFCMDLAYGKYPVC
jgi:S-adenosylmethionine synthetase